MSHTNRDCLTNRAWVRGERLEVRLPLAHLTSGIDGSTDFQLDLHVAIGDTSPGMSAPEIAVAGVGHDTTGDGQAIGLDDGSQVVVFSARFDEQTGVFARRIRADGHPDGPVFDIAANVATDSLQPVRVGIAPRLGGEFIAFWMDINGIHGQTVDAKDVGIGDPFDVMSGSLPIGPELEIVRLDDAGFFIVWNDFENRHLVGLKLDETGRPLNQDIVTLVSPISGHEVFDFQLFTQSAADFAIAWSEFDVSLQAAEKRVVQHFDASGEAAGDPIILNTSEFLVPPRAAILEDTSLVLVGPPSGSSTSMVVELREPGGDVVRRHELNGASQGYLPFADVAALADGGFVVTYERITQGVRDIILQRFNADSEPIGAEVQANEHGQSYLPDAAVIPLASNGYAAYWLGVGLDGFSPVVMSRSFRFFATQLNIGIDEPDQLDPFHDYIVRIEGLPHELGLSEGIRPSPDVWEVPLSNANSIEILSLSPPPVLLLHATLVDAHTMTAIASSDFGIGTPLDDLLAATSATSVSDGRGGSDILFVAGLSSDFEVIEFTSDLLVLESLDLEVLTLMRNIEFVGFDDGIVSVEQLLLEQDEPPTPEPDDSDDDVLSLAELAEIAFLLDAFELIEFEDFTDYFEDAGPSSILDFVQNAVESLVDYGQSAEDAVEHEFDDSALEPETDADTEDEPPDEEAEVDSESPETTSETSSDSEIVDPMAIDAEYDANGKSDTGQTSKQPSPANGGRVDNVSPSRSDERIAATAAAMRSVFQRDFAPRGVANGAPDPGDKHSASDPVTAEQRLFQNSALTVMTSFDSQQLFAEIEQVEGEVAADARAVELVAGTAVIVATGFSLAQVAWLLRGSVLVTKILSSVPIWVAFDPLPMLSGIPLARDRASQRANDESLVDIAQAR